MGKSEKLFHQIINEVSDAVEGKMFGASCIKTKNGKAAAILWKDSMLFKLDETSRQEALMLDGSHIAAHLYAPDKLMKEWVTIPFRHSDKWIKFTKKSIAFVTTLEKNKKPNKN